MKSLFKYILEQQTDEITIQNACIVMTIYKDILGLAEYIFNKIGEYANTPKEDKPEELYINFKDIPKFKNTYGLNSFRQSKFSDYDEYYKVCDMVISFESLGKDTLGAMEEDDPILVINRRKVSTQSGFVRNTKNIKNTIIHELSHYIQSQSKNMKFNSDDYDIHGELGDLLKDEKYYEYYIYFHILYAIGLRESEARVNGFIGTLQYVLKRLSNKYKNNTEEELIDFIIYNKKFDDNEIHTVLFSERQKEIENDTWERFKKCKDSKDPYLQDSPIYMILKLSENRGNLPELVMPCQDQNNLINSIKTKEDFEKYKKELLEDYRQKMKAYIDGLKEVTRFMIHNK